jgi:hypothetical protein
MQTLVTGIPQTLERSVQSRKVCHAPAEALLAVSTVPPMTTSFCREVSTITALKRRQRTRVSCIALALPTPSGDSILLSASIEDEGIRESRGRRTSSRYGRPFKVSYWRLVYRVADQM